MITDRLDLAVAGDGAVRYTEFYPAAVIRINWQRDAAGTMIDELLHALRRVLHIIARPAKSERAQDGIVIQTYRGFGSQDEVYFMGRVFRQFEFMPAFERGSMGRDLFNIMRRFLRWGIADAEITARFNGTVHHVVTDRDGYFDFHMHLDEEPPADVLWHEVDLELTAPKKARAQMMVEVFIPPPEAQRIIISDIDDTVMYTGVANKIKMMWRLFVQGAKSRTAFPGVAPFYRALHEGSSGDEKNPMLYVSRGPWSIYELLEEFFNLHEIPAGPVLFLREWGLTPQRPLPKRSKDHKLDLCRKMMTLYDGYPFILIGDSGQKDPELYAQIVQEYPERIEAIYIRNVNPGSSREHAIKQLALETEKTGTSLILTDHSYDMAKHASDNGFIKKESVAEIVRECAEAEEG